MAVGLGKLAHQPASVGSQLDLLVFVIVFVVLVFDELRRDLGGPAIRLGFELFDASSASAPMISGVRASSMRMLSASSTSMKCSSRCTGCHRPSSRPARAFRRKVALAFADPPQQQSIAEEIEAEFLGRAVGDVAAICLARGRPADLRLDARRPSCRAFRRSAASSRRRAGRDNR